MIHQTAGFAVGHQSAKGTAAATYVRARASSSRAWPTYDTSDPTGQHTGVHERPTTRQSRALRTRYGIDVQASGRLYPLLLPMLLAGVGFGVSTANNTTYYTHTMTLADADAQKYLSVLRHLDEGSARYSQINTDVRLSQLQIQADRNGIIWTVQGMGLDQADAAGTETETQEPDLELSPNLGSFTITSSDVTAATIGKPRSLSFTIDNPLGEDSQELHSLKRANLTPTGLDVSGELTGLVLSEGAFREFYYGADDGAAETVVIPEAQIVWVWQTPANIAGASVPHKVTVTIPTVQLMAQPVDVTGGGEILYNVQWQMIDSAASAPITIAVDNSKTAYTAD